MNETDTRVVEIEQPVKARPEVVFAYFTDPERHASWLGYRAELDPRPGGVYRVHIAPGVEIAGEYLVVEPSTHLVFTWGWRSPAPLPGDVHELQPGSTVVDISLEPDGDGTMLRVRHSGFPVDGFAASHGHGWRYGLDRLRIAAEGGDPGPHDPLAMASIGGGVS